MTAGADRAINFRILDCFCTTFWGPAPMPDFWTEFNQGFQGRLCQRGDHPACPHFVAMGGGFNPRRLRPEFGASLCRCSCHAGCPVTGRRLAVPFKVWRESCTCQGAEHERQRLADAGLEPPDFAELREQAERRRQARREAFQATSQAAAGMSKAQIQDFYAAELRARQLRVPREEVLAAVADRVMGNPLPSYKIAGEGLLQMSKATIRVARLFRDITRPPT
jgi:hypothetical protein